MGSGVSPQLDTLTGSTLFQLIVTYVRLGEQYPREWESVFNINTVFGIDPLTYCVPSPLSSDGRPICRTCGLEHVSVGAECGG